MVYFVSIPGGEDPLEEEMAPPPVFLPGRSPGQRSLAGCSSLGCKESDMTERLNNNGLFYHFRIYRAENNSWRTGCVQ